jgi:DNA-binding transcriptional MerR regulator
MTRNLMPIGRFAAASRLSVRMLRHYDEAGLLRPAWVDPSSGYRYYSHAQAPTAEIIRLLRQLGMPLDEIREILQARDPELVRGQLARHRQRIEAQLTSAQRTLTYLERLIQQVDDEGEIVAYEIMVKDVEPQTVLSRRGRASMEQVGAWIDQNMGAMMAHLAAHGAQIEDPPGLIYNSFDSGQDEQEIELYVPLAAPLPDGDAIVCYELPGGTAAYALHVGPYEELGAVYQALSEWIQRNGHETAGPPREIYITDPREVPSPADYQTEVIWPIR